MKRKRKNTKTMKYKIYAFAATLLVFSVAALIIPLRPKESEIEKRTLSKFPKPSLETLWNGEFFEGVSLWYADTFPFREQLIAGNMECRSTYGLQKKQIYGSMQASADVEGETEKEEKKDGKEEEKVVKDGKKQREITQIQEQFGAVYVAEDTAFSLYGFNAEAVDQYIAAVNTLAAGVGEDVNVYDMIVPISTGVYLDPALQEQLGSSDQKEAIQYIYDGLDDRVKVVDVFATLEDHNDEYLYFRTDHHWTALGAYYAYCEFMEQKKIAPTPLESYQTMVFDNFVGTMYSYCNQASALGSNPDTVTAYVPVATNEMQFTDINGETMDYQVIADVSTWAGSSKYNCFIGGDQPIGWVHNPTLADGSACLLIKESFGNAFAPFLVDHYEYVYIVDYRYYLGGLLALVQEKNIKDVLLLNNVSAASSSTLVPNLAEIAGY